MLIIGEHLKVTIIENVHYCIGGLGKMFYQEGFPISIGAKYLKDKYEKEGIKMVVSPFHVADECLKHGWSPETTFRKLKEELIEDSFEDIVTEEDLKKFCHAEYEDQREMIFQYLFGTTYEKVRSGEDTKPLDFVRNFVTFKEKK